VGIEALHTTALQIVTGPAASGRLVEVGDTSAATRTRALLASEASLLEAQHGKNPYSDYLLRYHTRPSPEEAAAMGRRLGGRVEAADGTLQPALTGADKLAIRGIRARRKAASRKFDQIMRLRSAVALLAKNQDHPADLIAGGSILFDCSEIANQLELALSWLSLFAEEWHRREKENRAGDAEYAVCAQSKDGC